MGVKVGINGFGRIGRNVFRAAFDRKDVEIVAVNDLTNAETLAMLLQYDSVHGKFPYEVTADGSDLIVNDRRIRVFSERDPGNLPWASVGVEIVIESTGIFTEKSKAEVHITKGGAKKVIISRPPPMKTSRSSWASTMTSMTRRPIMSSQTPLVPQTVSRRSRKCCMRSLASFTA